MKNSKYDIIIIGSGLGGLLSGYMMAREGKSVCILEKNDVAGGCLRSFMMNGRSFNTGVHYFGGYDEGQPLRRYWEYFGLTGKINAERMPETGFDIVSLKGKEYPLAAGKKNFIERLLPYFPKEKDKISKFIFSLDQITSRLPLYNPDIPGLTADLTSRGDSAWEFFSSFSDPDGILPNVLSGNNFLYAGKRDKTPLYSAAIIMHSFISGAWRIEGGSAQIADALTDSVTGFGGEILTGQEVISIEKKNEEFLVSTRSGNFSSDLIISDIHPASTLALVKNIPLRRTFSERISGLSNTGSCMTLFCGMKEKSFPWFGYNLHCHETYDSWSDGPFPQSFLMYTGKSGQSGWAGTAVIMSKTDISMFREWEGKNPEERGPSYQEKKKEMAEKLLDLAEKKFPGFRQQISFLSISTPLTWRDRTGSPGGSMYGAEKDFHEPLLSWIPPRTKIEGLYFTGQSTNLHGVLGVTIGAVQTCGEILGIDYLLKKIRNG